MTIWAIIPARAGSKRIPGKNASFVGGSTLLSRAITLGKKFADCVGVTTDEEGWLTYANSMKCWTRLRPAALADDETHAVYAVIDAMDHWNVDDDDTVAMCLPTSPFASWEAYNQAMWKLTKHPTIVGVWERHRVNVLGRDVFGNYQSQLGTQGKCQIVNSQLYLAKAYALRQHKSFYQPFMGVHITPQPFDIDEPADLDAAQQLIEQVA